MDRPRVARRAVLGGIVATLGTLAGCVWDADREDESDPESSPNFGYGGEPVIAGDETDSRDEVQSEPSSDRDGNDSDNGGDQVVLGFGDSDPDLGAGEQGYGEHGYGGVPLD